MNKLFLRNVMPEDEMLILKWKNDAECIKNSFSKEYVTSEVHHEWFHKILQKDTVFFYILTDGAENIGQIRIDMEHGSGVISYSIASEFRKKGYAKKMLLLFIRKLNEVPMRPKRLIAEVKRENYASASLFRTLGFTEKITSDKLIFELILPNSQGEKVE